MGTPEGAGHLLLPDISEFQGGANLGGIKSRNGGAIILRAYNGWRADHDFAAFRAEAHIQHYQVIGVYCYVVNRSFHDQVQAFAATVGALRPGEFPVMDFEDPAFSGDLLSAASSFLAGCDTAFGLTHLPLDKRSWLYSYPDFIARHNLGPIFASPRRTWLADYTGTEPSSPGHTLWQSTNGVVGANRTDWPGAGFCDTDQFDGSLTQLASLISRSETAVPVHVTQGKDSLSQLCQVLPGKPHESTVLRMTAEHSPHGMFTHDLSQWLGDVFRGHVSVHEPMPAHMKLYYPAAAGAAMPEAEAPDDAPNTAGSAYAATLPQADEPSS